VDKVQCFFLGVGISGSDFAPEIIPSIKCLLKKSAIRQIAAIATLDKRGGHPLIATLSQEFNAEILLFPVRVLAAQRTRLANPQPWLYARIGCHGVAEASALAAAGEQARLVIAKTICHKVTFAVAG